MSSPLASALGVAFLLVSPRPHADAGALRARARQVLIASHCDKCHDSSLNRDHAKALSVYDLDRAEWPATMSDAQLPKMLSRLRGVAAADQQVIRDFVRAELRSRASQRR